MLHLNFTSEHHTVFLLLQHKLSQIWGEQRKTGNGIFYSSSHGACRPRAPTRLLLRLGAGTSFLLRSHDPKTDRSGVLSRSLSANRLSPLAAPAAEPLTAQSRPAAGRLEGLVLPLPLPAGHTAERAVAGTARNPPLSPHQPAQKNP